MSLERTPDGAPDGPPVRVRDGDTRVLHADDHRPPDPSSMPSPDTPGRSRHRRLALWGLIMAGGLLFGVASGYALHDSGLQLSTDAPADGATLNARDADALIFRISADIPSLMDTATLEYDGSNVLDNAFVDEGRLTYRPSDLSEGEHRLRFTINRPYTPGGRLERTWRFTVDTTRPQITIDAPRTAFVRNAPATVSGRVDEPARVTADGKPVTVAADGSFNYTMPSPPTRPVLIEAIDAAGNERGMRTSLPVAPRVPLEPTRAVHMTAISWKMDFLREPVLDMLRRGQINTIELDLKDEAGVVGYDSNVPLARRIGAVRPEYDLKEAVDRIHGLGGRVIGRIVAFRDPIHATYAWDNNLRDQVVQDPSGNPYAGYGGFTNFAHPAVKKYNIDIAREAAGAGVDDILYDYVRRPDGPIDSMRFPGMKGTASQQIVAFLRAADLALRPTGTFLGASLFGVAALHPDEIAQPVPDIARVVDYVAPMLYPSHWGPGSFDIADPDADPYATVHASMLKFNELTAGTGARVVPWLQDFSLRHDYGPEQVRAQIDAAAATGVNEWIMWDALVTYTTDAYPAENAGSGATNGGTTTAGPPIGGEEAEAPATEAASAQTP